MASSSRVRIRRKRDYGAGAMALTEYKVDRVRSRAASCNGLDRWIYNEILEGIENVVTLLIWLDDPHIRVSDAAWRSKVSEARTRGHEAKAYGEFGIWVSCVVCLLWLLACRVSAFDRFFQMILMQSVGDLSEKSLAPSRKATMKGADEQLGARGLDGQCDKAPAWGGRGECRVMASPSGVVRSKPAGRAVASRVGRFRL